MVEFGKYNPGANRGTSVWRNKAISPRMYAVYKEDPNYPNDKDKKVLVGYGYTLKVGAIQIDSLKNTDQVLGKDISNEVAATD